MMRRTFAGKGRTYSEILAWWMHGNKGLAKAIQCDWGDRGSFWSSSQQIRCRILKPGIKGQLAFDPPSHPLSLTIVVRNPRVANCWPICRMATCGACLARTLSRVVLHPPHSPVDCRLQASVHNHHANYASGRPLSSWHYIRYGIIL